MLALFVSQQPATTLFFSMKEKMIEHLFRTVVFRNCEVPFRFVSHPVRWRKWVFFSVILGEQVSALFSSEKDRLAVFGQRCSQNWTFWTLTVTIPFYYFFYNIPFYYFFTTFSIPFYYYLRWRKHAWQINSVLPLKVLLLQVHQPMQCVRLHGVFYSNK